MIRDGWVLCDTSFGYSLGVGARCCLEVLGGNIRGFWMVLGNDSARGVFEHISFELSQSEKRV